jgi:hypothetical protein
LNILTRPPAGLTCHGPGKREGAPVSPPFAKIQDYKKNEKRHRMRALFRNDRL